MIDKTLLPDEIQITWMVEDVQERAKYILNLEDDEDLELDDCLSREDARLVLYWLERNHDANEGINWETIDCCIETLRDEGLINLRKLEGEI